MSNLELLQHIGIGLLFGSDSGIHPVRFDFVEGVAMTPEDRAARDMELCDHGKDRSRDFCEECRLDEESEALMPGGFN